MLLYSEPRVPQPRFPALTVSLTLALVFDDPYNSARSVGPPLGFISSVCLLLPDALCLSRGSDRGTLVHAYRMMYSRHPTTLGLQLKFQVQELLRIDLGARPSDIKDQSA